VGISPWYSKVLRWWLAAARLEFSEQACQISTVQDVSVLDSPRSLCALLLFRISWLGGLLRWPLLLRFRIFDRCLCPLFCNQFCQLGVDLLVVTLEEDEHTESSRWCGCRPLTRSDLIKRAATSVLSLLSRSAAGFSTFWILSKYCLTRANSVKIGWCLVSTPLRRIEAAHRVSKYLRKMKDGKSHRTAATRSHMQPRRRA